MSDNKNKTVNPALWTAVASEYERTAALFRYAVTHYDEANLACAHMAALMQSEMDGLDYSASTEPEELLTLAIRMYHACGDPAFSKADWADAVVHFPSNKLKVSHLLALDDDAFPDILDRMACFKRETYSDMGHTESIDSIIACVVPSPDKN